jgi:membrane protease YdiL (CAAX protease family)
MATDTRYFAWQPTTHTALAGLAGLAAVALSAAMIPLARMPVLSAVVRDIAQVFLLGVLLPLIYLLHSGQSAREFGFHVRRWRLFLSINAALAFGLLVQFRRTDPAPADFAWSAAHLWLAAYVVLTLVFELIFFYGFLRTLFERAFGCVPGIVLAAVFYSLHHAGFQPEFTKLFFVGILYGTVYRLGHSALLIFPFFLAVGGVYDVLIKSKVVATVDHVEVRTVVLLLLMGAALLWVTLSLQRQKPRAMVSA